MICEGRRGRGDRRLSLGKFTRHSARKGGLLLFFLDDDGSNRGRR